MHEQAIGLGSGLRQRTPLQPETSVSSEHRSVEHDAMPPRVSRQKAVVLPRSEVSSQSVVMVRRVGSMGTLKTAAPLIVSDSISLSICVVAGILLASLLGGNTPVIRWSEIASALPLLLIYFLEGLYPAVGIHPVIEVRQIIRANAAVALAAAVVFAMAGASGIFLFSLAATALFSLLAVPLGRTIARRFSSLFAWWGIPVLICGVDEHVTQTMRLMLENPGCGLRPVVAADLCNYRGWRPRASGAKSAPFTETVLSPPRGTGAEIRVQCVSNGLLRMARRANLRHVVVVAEGAGSIQHLLSRLSRAFPHVLVIGGHAGLPTLFRDARDWQGMAGVEVRNRLLLAMPRALKRSLDLALVLISLPLLVPILLAIAVSIRLSAGGPVLFGHRRYGRRGQSFVAWKFRTMLPNADELLKAHLDAHPEQRAEWEKDHKLRDDPRVTRLGQLLRRSSLDELPQLWNVVRGQMSLVGPRPIVQQEIEKYGRGYLHYKQVMPGITGLWQVSGRNDTTYGQRVDLDRYYVENWSPWLDVWILCRTVRTLVTGRGAY